MKILFLDQSGVLGGAELCLIDIAKPYRQSCLIGLFTDGPFKDLLKQQHIPVKLLGTGSLKVRRESSLLKSLTGLSQLIPLIVKIINISYNYDLIYANTQKALVVATVVSFISRRPLIYHLHDILSTEHFSPSNLRIAVTLANTFASLVIANSQATQSAFIEAGGRGELTRVVYNGFPLECYQDREFDHSQLKQQLGFEGKFIVGHFSRLSPWKGQHILLESLALCPDDIVAILVGEALFGEQDYANYLHQRVVDLGLRKRVHFLGFRSDIVPLMKACNLIAHTSTEPEPFGRVVVEGMLCGRPVVATAAGGPMELLETGKTGWLIPPGNPSKLTEIIMTCRHQPNLAANIAQQAQINSQQRFDITRINQQIQEILSQVVGYST